ncbi:MAG: hypothetical protein B7Y56_10405 [Gallionellales bacterium 35-53-114]|jgi:hypothetical protein|nr:MAG: hypothetical protein B7Y56_10405 [Gallionellales bacterium 35-53-114]OYZ64959.1 MAG: hypothetical protein B7Y04_04190 [Gallionellales bacterium 24-53-125]OZB07503.1 MAG: hypothetical protein B7X61_12825 [Gallionellales bacterium 39-52-133]HQS58827.1 hypothetical protein [Gallionellaceae bacterium]HQS75168.1 hypothetical protein [Gallionellaceae bacterium]
MTKKIARGLVLVMLSAFALGGCALFGDGIPDDQKGNYALIVSNIGERGEDMDQVSREQAMYHSRANIGWVNGKPQFPARTSLNILPGEYEFSVGLGCSNSASCRPSAPISIVVKAGYRYALTTRGVFVSDRMKPWKNENETPYKAGN